MKLMENEVRGRVLGILMENKNPFGPYCRTQISAPALVHRGLVLFLAQDLYRLSVVQARISGVGGDIRFRPRWLEALFELITRADWPGTVRNRRRPPGPCLTVHPPRGLVSQSPPGPWDPQSLSCSLVRCSPPLPRSLFSTRCRGGCM